MAEDLILELKGITKIFPGVKALNKVHFQLRRGEVHALMGENGAGKSTFIKVITGVHAAEEGQMFLNGEEVHFRGPKDAAAAGIAAVYQHPTTYPELTVSENIFMGHEIMKGRFIQWQQMNAEAQKYLAELYKSGLSAAAVLQYTGELDEKRRKALQDHYNSLLTGAKNAHKVVAVPVGFQLQPIRMSMQEAQFVELRKYTALQIAAAFGIKPNQLNDYDKSSYSNSEMQQLSFLVDTMLYRLTQYEQELNYKCLSDREIREGFFFKFNEKAILRTDSKTQMDALRIGVNNGIYTPNEARAFLDRHAMDGGDILMCNGNYIPVTSVGEKGGNTNGGS